MCAKQIWATIFVQHGTITSPLQRAYLQERGQCLACIRIAPQPESGNHVKKSSLMFAFCCNLLCSLPASAHGFGDGWIVFIAAICAAQDPSYADTLIGKRLQETDLFKDQATLECFRKRQWMSKSLCDDVMSINENSNLPQIYTRHEKELESREEAYTYLNDIDPTKIIKTPKVECPKGK